MSGHQRLWGWFGMTYSSWLTMPRVMMHAMPDDWQDRMAELCEEWDATWQTNDMPSPKVSAVDHNGKFTRWPKWVLNYRHPDTKELERLRATRADIGG
jgi:hypothetical protein